MVERNTLTGVALHQEKQTTACESLSFATLVSHTLPIFNKPAIKELKEQFVTEGYTTPASLLAEQAVYKGKDERYPLDSAVYMKLNPSQSGINQTSSSSASSFSS